MYSSIFTKLMQKFRLMQVLSFYFIKVFEGMKNIYFSFVLIKKLSNFLTLHKWRRIYCYSDCFK